ncbi:MFS transporter [Streptomyces sp. NPDC053792]|uniref:MFS transporter n=1 Tax=Streptomyces sp. NPDC053792 TaxID=3365716 RepID=UPI0037D00738
MIGTGSKQRTSRAVAPYGPQRALIIASFVSRVGNGLFNTAAVLCFTLVVHLPAAQVGVGLTIAAVTGLLAGIQAGNLADRYGPRTVWLASLAMQAATMAAFVFIDSWATFTLIATLDRLAATVGGAAGGALIARAGGERPAAFRARLRTFVNLGVVLGTLGAAFAVSVNTRPAYTALILANAVSFACTGLIALIGVPNYRPLHRPKEHRSWAVLADRPYVSFVALYGAMGLQYQTVSLLLPLWLSAHTDAPRWTVAAVYAVNSEVCVLLQSRIGSRVETPRQGGRAFRVAGLLFLVSCPLMALTADVPSWVAPGARHPRRLRAQPRRGVGVLGRLRARLRSHPRPRPGAVPGPLRHRLRRRSGLGPGDPHGGGPRTRAHRPAAAGRVLRGSGAGGPLVAAWAERTRPAGQDPACAAHGGSSEAPLLDAEENRSSR